MKTRLILSLSIAAVLSSLSSVRAIQITYDVTLFLNPGPFEGGILGTITTDGKLGVIGASDILSWNLTGIGYGTFQASLNSSDSFVQVGNNTQVPGSGTPDLTATAQHLFFNFDGTDGGYLAFSTEPLPAFVDFIDFNAQNPPNIFPYDIYSFPSETVGGSMEPYLALTHGNQIIGTAPAASAVPDLPDTLPLLGLGLGALVAFSRRLQQ
jgi:hypothetical protein